MANLVSQAAEPYAAPHPAGRLYCSAIEAGAWPRTPRKRFSGRAFYATIVLCAAAHLCALIAILCAPRAEDQLAGTETAFEIIDFPPAVAGMWSRSWSPGEHTQEFANRRFAGLTSTPAPKLDAPLFSPVTPRLVATASRAQAVRELPAALVAPHPQEFDRTELDLKASFGKTNVPFADKSAPRVLTASAPQKLTESPLRAAVERPDPNLERPALRFTRTKPSKTPQPVEAQRAAEQLAAQAAERARALATERMLAAERAKSQAAERKAAVAERLDVQRQLRAQHQRETLAEQKLLAAQKLAAQKLAAQKLAAQKLAAQQRKAAEEAKIKRLNEEAQRAKAAQEERARRAAVAYRVLVSGRIASRERYPQAAVQRLASGVARVRLEIAASGALRSVAIQVSSGDGVLDVAALEAVRRAGPFPAPPPGAPRIYVAPVAFRPSG